MELRKTLSKFWQNEQMNTYNTCIPPFWRGSRARRLIIFGHVYNQTLKITFRHKKVRHFDPFWRNDPLNKPCSKMSQSIVVRRRISLLVPVEVSRNLYLYTYVFNTDPCNHCIGFSIQFYHSPSKITNIISNFFY